MWEVAQNVVKVFSTSETSKRFEKNFGEFFNSKRFNKDHILMCYALEFWRLYKSKEFAVPYRKIYYWIVALITWISLINIPWFHGPLADAATCILVFSALYFIPFGSILIWGSATHERPKHGYLQVLTLLVRWGILSLVVFTETFAKHSPILKLGWLVLLSALTLQEWLIVSDLNAFSRSPLWMEQDKSFDIDIRLHLLDWYGCHIPAFRLWNWTLFFWLLTMIIMDPIDGFGLTSFFMGVSVFLMSFSVARFTFHQLDGHVRQCIQSSLLLFALLIWLGEYLNTPNSTLVLLLWLRCSIFVAIDCVGGHIVGECIELIKQTEPSTRTEYLTPKETPRSKQYEFSVVSVMASQWMHIEFNGRSWSREILEQVVPYVAIVALKLPVWFIFMQAGVKLFVIDVLQ